MPLDGQTLPMKARSRNQNLRQEICPHVAVKVWKRALEICWECSSLCYTHIQCQSTTILGSLHLWGATWWPNIAWMPEASRNQNLRQEICPHVAVKVWKRALEICWECSSLCYTHIQCQSTTILGSLHLWGATWWPNIAWKPSQQKSKSEARNLPPCGCKSMKEGPRNMLGVFITLLYPYIQCQSTTILGSLHLWGATWWPNIAWKPSPAEIKIWGKKSAPMWL